MTVQLVLLKSGEELVADVREIVHKETEQQMSLVFINPHSISYDDDVIEFEPWLPLSESRQFYIPYDWVVTITKPIESIVDEFNQQFGEENDSQSDSAEDERVSDLGD